MTLPISPRLLACAGFVRPGARVADVGCDHGYLGIYLLTNGIAASVIASDLREGPLQSARINAARYKTDDRTAFYLSDGVRQIPRDFDTLVCAGMGAETMISILSAAPWLRSPQYRLILQCQTKTHLLRRWLSEEGWAIEEEAVEKDGKFLYTVMTVVYAPDRPRLTPGQWYFSPAMLENQTDYVVRHYRWVLKELTKIVTSRGYEPGFWMADALQELAAMEEKFPFLKEESK